MKRSIFLILCFLVTWARGQSFLPLNSSNPDIYQIGFFNPAPMALAGKYQATVGMQFLHAGLAGNTMRTSYLCATTPLGAKGSVGLRAHYFTSDIYQNMELSLLASRTFYSDKVAIGINLNLLQHSYDKNKFVNVDMNDPLFANGTSSSAFSVGGGLYYQPVQGLNIGIAANHINEPDISINHSGFHQPMVYTAGLSYAALPVIPQFDVYLEREDLFTQFGLHLRMLEQQLRLFAGYSKIGKDGSLFLTEAELRLDNFGILYAFQYPLTEDFSHLSSGSHQIGILFNGGRPQASMPSVLLERIDSTLQIPQLWLKGQATNQDGLTSIDIHVNDRLWKTIPANILKKATSYDLSETVPLELERNVIQVTAKGKKRSTVDRIVILFEPPPPQIEIRSERNIQVRTGQYQLLVRVRDLNELKRVRIYQDSKLLENITSFQNIKEMDLSRLLTLAEGINTIRVEVDNLWSIEKDSLWIVNKGAEPLPSMTINSPDLPISASSQIIINLNLNNAENIKEVVIKVNGTVVDAARIMRLKLFEERTVAGYDSMVVVNLPYQNKNLIEAIAVDDQGLPRISQSLNAYYNPYARDMRYSRKRAFIIGINNYQSNEVPDLVDAVPDARKVATVLDSLYHFDRIDLLLDEQADFATLYTLFSDSLLQAKPGELLVIYFSGHGDKLGGGDGDALGFLLPWDAGITSHSKRITMDYINGYLRRTPAADVLCIFDACFSGASIISRPEFTYDLLPRHVAYDSLRQEVNKRALNLITAATRNEAAVDGLFTNILVRGLTGAADRNDDGYITSTELAMYVQKYTSDEARNRYLREQNPQFGGLTSERGECVFERRK